MQYHTHFAVHLPWSDDAIKDLRQILEGKNFFVDGFSEFPAWFQNTMTEENFFEFHVDGHSYKLTGYLQHDGATLTTLDGGNPDSIAELLSHVMQQYDISSPVSFKYVTADAIDKVEFHLDKATDTFVSNFGAGFALATKDGYAVRSASDLFPVLLQDIADEVATGTQLPATTRKNSLGM